MISLGVNVFGPRTSDSIAQSVWAADQQIFLFPLAGGVEVQCTFYSNVLWSAC